MTDRRFRFPWRSRHQIVREVDAELDFHLQMRMAELIRAGATAGVAADQARSEFGDLDFTRRYCSDVDTQSDRSLRMNDHVAGWRQDIEYAVRTLRRAPGFAVTVIITLALAIGANTAIFSVARGILFRPLPYGHPDAIVSIFIRWFQQPDQRNGFSPPDFADYVAQQHSFSAIAGMAPGQVSWIPDAGDPAVVRVTSVSPSIFGVLQLRMERGEPFHAGDDTPAGAHKAIATYAFWQRSLGGDPARIGKPLRLEGESYQLVGVLPPGVSLDNNEELWLPLDITDDLTRATITRKQHWLSVVGRIRTGVTPAAADAELATIAARLALQYPAADSGRTAYQRPLRQQFTRQYASGLHLLLGGAALVLLIACANLANVTLARTTARRREIAVRAALGAGRGRLVRQLLVESIVLAITGGGLGVALASIATRTLLALNPDAVPPFFVIGIDPQVLLFSLALALVTGVLFGLVPALDAGRADLNSTLRDAGRGSSGGRSGIRIRRGLVMTQMGLAVVLLTGTGLLLRSFDSITRAPRGYSSDHVLTADIRASGPRFDSTTVMNQFFDNVIDRLNHAPGIVAASATTRLATQGHMGTSVRIAGQPVDEASIPDLGYIGVRPGYFTAMGIPIRAGRDYNATDLPDGPKTAIINEAAAHRFFPKGDAVGQQIMIGPNPHGQWMTIVGVAGDIRDEAMDLPAKPTLYANHRQESWEHTVTLVVRTTGDPVRATELIRRAVAAVDPTVPVQHIVTLDDVLGSSLATRKLSLALVGGFGALALLLAAIGIYGVLAYSVTSRTREFGVRLALGGTPGSVRGLIIRQGITWAVPGLLVGVGVAAGAARLLQGMLYGVTPIDPMTYAAVLLSLVAVVVVASVVPAIRATRVDPITSMRAE